MSVNNWQPIDEYTLHLPHNQPTAPEIGATVTLADMVELWYTNAGKIQDLICAHIDLQRAIRTRQKQPLAPEMVTLYENKCAKPETTASK